MGSSGNVRNILLTHPFQPLALPWPQIFDVLHPARSRFYKSLSGGSRSIVVEPSVPVPAFHILSCPANKYMITTRMVSFKRIVLT